MQRRLHGPCESRVRLPLVELRPAVAQRQSSRQRLLLPCHRSIFASLRSSKDAELHKPACEGSTPSAATNVPESSNGRTRGFDPRDESSTPSSGADSHLDVAQSGESARFGTERLRVRISPPRPMRNLSSGDGSYLTN